MKRLGAMVVGPGWVAEEHIKAYLSNPATELMAIAGVIEEDEERAKKLMEKLNFKCDYIPDYEKALEREDIDIVSVCTINFLHFNQTLLAIQAGKNVLTEKPLAFSLEEAGSLAREAKKRNVKTHVGHVGRFYPAVKKIKEIIGKGLIGDIFYGESDYWHEIVGPWKVKIKTGGSSLLMGGVHAVDMVRFLMGEAKNVKQVFAYSREGMRRKDFEYHPTIAMLIQFEDGAIGKVSSSLECNMPYVFHIQMCGETGTVRSKGYYSAKISRGKAKFMDIEGDYPDDWDVSHHPFPEEIAYFVDCIAKDRESELSFERAYPTYEVIFAAEESCRTNKPVDLPLKKS